MNNDVEVEGRPRPLSTGLWTLFSWLRRDDRSDSSDSLSSAGSDRTVASFAFLTPARYLPARGPLVIPPPGPPTDSYKKRVHDRNLRRHHDRDITLHRKYGLFKSEGNCGYDAFSLPPARRINVESGNRWDRDRRATSECYQRRSAHVPGKRRAPLPPVTAAGSSASLPRRYTRKRPAPQPPGRLLEKNRDILKNVEVNIRAAQMSSNAYQDNAKTRNNDVTMGCKSEKYSKKDATTKETKTKPDKSFLKQIFDSKKRNSYIDTSAVKLLPSISELDKQAAEIIETCKLKATEQNNNITFQRLDGAHSSHQDESWFCVSCLRKYDSTVIACVYCASKQKVQSSKVIKDYKEALVKTVNQAFTQTEKDLLPNRKCDAEDKQKLREMLKEMKDSLPKRLKQDVSYKSEKQSSVEPKSSGRKNYSTETPTLRVGTTSQDERKTNSLSEPSTSNVELKSVQDAIGLPKKPYPTSTQAALVAQVISAHQKTANNNLNLLVKPTSETVSVAKAEVVDSRGKAREPEKSPSKQTQAIKILNTPLKISSLLNPMFVPKSSLLDKPHSTYIEQNELKSENLNPDKVTSENVHRISQSTSVPAPSSEVLVVPSTSKTDASFVNIVKIENQPKTEIEQIPKGGQNTLQIEKPPVVLSNPREVSELNNKSQRSIISKLPTLAKDQNSTNKADQDQHSRRRDLINQLEKSIARGDERAAAEAAAKLAQLRLSCSVLSFSSQILSQPSASSTNSEELKGGNGEPNKGISITKLNNDSNKKEHNVSQGLTSNLNERSSPKVVVRKANSNAVVVPNKVTTPLVTKAETSVLLPVQKKTDEHIQRKEKDAKKETPNKLDDNIVTIAVLVEDREATRGPVRLRINRQACIRDLRREAETSLGLASNLQRWIVGRVLCVNDSTPIISLAGPDFSAPFYLCVVESETKLVNNPLKQKDTAIKNTNDQRKTGDVYTELVQLEQQALVPNAENFECGVCMEEYPPGQGVILRECVHIFCKDCLTDVVRHCEEPNVPCPAIGCRGMLQEREIRALVPAQDYERWLARGLAAAESGTRNAFHCRTRDCKGWALCEPGVQRFPCPVCRCINCVPCQAIHDGHTCEQHRAKLKEAADGSTNANDTDDGTRTLLNSLIRKGEALECPECSAIITKKWGCDWVKCSACKTEICWVTRGRRWGPGGKGDTSGGCRCGVDGKRCHPSCGYCH